MQLNLPELQQKERSLLAAWAKALDKVPTDAHYVDYAFEKLGVMLGEVHFPKCPELFAMSIREKGKALNKIILPMCAGELISSLPMAPFLRMTIAALNADEQEIAMYRHMHDNGVKLLGMPYGGLFANSLSTKAMHLGQRVVIAGYLPATVEYVGTAKNAPESITGGFGENRPDPLTTFALLALDDTFQTLHGTYFPRKIVVGDVTPIGLIEPIS